jgi:hypothetical protein
VEGTVDAAFLPFRETEFVDTENQEKSGNGSECSIETSKIVSWDTKIVRKEEYAVSGHQI